MMFVTSGVPVYEGQIVGENRREKDMNVNVTRAKKLTNVRAAGKDEAAVLSPPREVQIEWALEWMADDELLEVTPSNLRLAQARPARQSPQTPLALWSRPGRSPGHPTPLGFASLRASLASPSVFAGSLHGHAYLLAVG